MDSGKPVISTTDDDDIFNLQIKIKRVFLNTKQTMKQYRQHRGTNEQTWTTEYIAPVCNTYLQHRQAIGHRQRIYLQLTHKYDVVCT